MHEHAVADVDRRSGRAPAGDRHDALPLSGLAVSHPGDRREREAAEVEARLTGSGALATALPAVGAAAEPAGAPLDEATRSHFERHLRHDLGAVRIHAEGHAGAQAERLGARAFTVGTHVTFGPGQYRPDSVAGRRLLAHELMHVVQNEVDGADVPHVALRSPLAGTVGELGPREAGVGAVRRGRAVGKYARVGPVQPYLTVRTEMDDRRITALPDPLVLAALQLDDRVFVLEEFPRGWAKVRTDDGAIGYTWSEWLFVGAPDPDARLYRIREGDTALGIAQEMYDCGEWGQDGRFFVNVLVAVNQASGDTGTTKNSRKGIYRAGNRADDDVGSWKDTKLLAGYWIWIPGESFARSLAGTVSSGSVTFELWQSVKGAVGFVVGVLDGVATTLISLVTDLVDLVSVIVDTVVDIARRGIAAKVRQLRAFVDELDVEKIASTLWSDFKNRWDAADAYEQWKFRGVVVGTVLAEIALAALSGGATVALKVAGKAGKLAKLAAALSKVDTVATFARGVDRAGDATDAGRTARRALAAKKARDPEAGNVATGEPGSAAATVSSEGRTDAPQGGADGGLRFELTEHQGSGLEKLARSGGDWSTLSKVEKSAVGTLIHRLMEGLVARLAEGGWTVVRRGEVTPANVAAWRRAGQRVVLVESDLPSDGRTPRLDIAEIDFAEGRVTVMDYVPTSRAAHRAKTAEYGADLSQLTGLPAAAVDVEYVSAGQLVDDLALP